MEYVPREEVTLGAGCDHRGRKPEGRRLTQNKVKRPQFVTDRAERPALHPQSAIFLFKEKLHSQRGKNKTCSARVAGNSEIPRQVNSSDHQTCRKKKKALGIIEQLLSDGGSSYDAPLNHLLGDLTGHHATGLCVLRGHHHALCGEAQEAVLVFEKQRRKIQQSFWTNGGRRGRGWYLRSRGRWSWCARRWSVCWPLWAGGRPPSSTLTDCCTETRRLQGAHTHREKRLSVLRVCRAGHEKSMRRRLSQVAFKYLISAVCLFSEPLPLICLVRPKFQLEWQCY